jgi:hypothetical protein
MEMLFRDLGTHPGFTIVAVVALCLIFAILLIMLGNYIRISRMERDLNDLKVILFGRNIKER